jgi:hypothetical protein
MTVPSVDQVVTVIDQLRSLVELVSVFINTYIFVLFVGEKCQSIPDSRSQRATSSPGAHG